VNKAVRDSGLPEGGIEMQRGENDPVVVIDVQKAVATRASGIAITTFDLRDGVIHLEARIDTVRVAN
jgi:hypothetical protein